MNAAELTPDEKLKFLHDQIVQVKQGDSSSIFCPYCGVRNRPSEEYLCCKLFAEATSAILDRMDKTDAIEFMQKAADNATRRIH